MTDLNYYKAFGLTIASELVISELIPIEPCKAQVRISEGISGEYKWDDDGLTYSDNGDELTFHKAGVAEYTMLNGIEIVVVAEPLADPNDVKLFLLGSAFGTLLIQRNLIAYHGSALVYKGMAFVLTGESGAGKSSLATWFRTSGYKMLTDDVACVQDDRDGTPVIAPSYPRQKMWRDTANYFNQSLEACDNVGERLDKFSISIENNFHYHTVPFKAIVELIPTDTTEKVTIEEINGPLKMGMLFNHIYRVEVVDMLSKSDRYFDRVHQLSQVVRFYRLKRPVQGYSLKQQGEAILHVLDELTEKTNDRNYSVRE